MRINTLILVLFLATSSQAWSQLIDEDMKILATDGDLGDVLGNSIAIDNGIIAVGARFDDDNNFSGSAYLFDATTGVQLAKLLPNDGAINDRFGSSIAIHNGIVAVGAPYDDDNGENSGAVYLFDTNTGKQIAKLLPNDGAPEDDFGHSVSIHNGTVAVGARFADTFNRTDSGTAYLFDAITGVQIAKLLPIVNQIGIRFWFGQSIAIHNGIVAVGSKASNGMAVSTGAVFLFDATDGSHIAKLIATDGESGDAFGWSVDIDNGIVAIGAYRDSDLGNQSGSAYLFDVATTTQLAKLLPSDGRSNDEFGSSIAIDNGTIIVGSPDSLNRNGSAYFYDALDGTQIAKLIASDGTRIDILGTSVALSGGQAAIGASNVGHIINSNGFGAIYTVDIGSACFADLTGDGLLNFNDIAAFIDAFINADPIANFAVDNAFNFFDVSAFLQAFSAGCP